MSKSNLPRPMYLTTCSADIFTCTSCHILPSIFSLLFLCLDSFQSLLSLRSLFFFSHTRSQLAEPRLTKMSEEPNRKRRRTSDDLNDSDDSDYEPDDSDSESSCHEAPGETVNLGQRLDDYNVSYYDARQDGPPDHPAFSDLFRNIRNQADSISENARRVFERSECKYLARLIDRHNAIMQHPKPGVVRIALVGQPGSGKSSLINSVLDCPDLAATGSSGSSCTNVAVEFSAPFHGQHMPFAAEIIFHEDGLRDFILQLIEDFRRPLGGSDETSSDIEDDIPEDDLNNGKNSAQAESSLSILLGLLRNHPHLSGEDGLREYLQGDTFDENGLPILERLVDSLHGHVAGLIHDQCEGNSVKTIYKQGETADKLNGLLKQYTRNFESSQEPQLWPLVKLIRIGLQNRQLLEHIIIADLPGLDDENRLRCEATHKYLYQCDAAWIISPIQRVCDSSHVLNKVRSLNQRMEGRVTLVCTKTDADADTALLNELSMNQNSADIAALRKEKASEPDKRASINRLECRCRREKNPEAKKDFKQMLADQKKMFKESQHRAMLTLIKLRIQYVQTVMKKRVPTLSVFGVSNKLYKDLRFTNPDKGFHQLRPDDTVIKQLRLHSLRIPGDRTWKSFQQLCRGPLKDFRDYLAIFIQSGDIQNRHRWQDKLEIPSTAIERTIEEYFVNGARMFEQLIIAPIRRAEDKHRLHALEASEQWQLKPYNHTIYNKFGRNKGSFCHPKIPNQNWNEQLAGSVKQDLKRKWTDLRNKQEDVRDNCFTILSGRIQNSLPWERVQEEENPLFVEDKPAFVQQFQEMTVQHSEPLKTALAEDFGRLRDLIGRIQWRIEGSGTDSYVGSELEYTYKSIAQEFGRGMKMRMHKAMSSRLEDRNRDLIDVILDRAKEDLGRERTPHRRMLESEINNITQKIEENFKAMSEDLPLDEELSEIRKTLTEFQEKIVRPKMDRIEKGMKELQRQYFAGAP